MKGRSRMLFTLSLAQAGEFASVLIGFTHPRHVAHCASEQLPLVVALSMLITPALFIAYEVLPPRK